VKSNKFGVPHLKAVRLKRGIVYFWTPPRALQRAGVFRFATLGTDFDLAVAKARDLNLKLDSYRAATTPKKPLLADIQPMTVGHLFRQFEASPRFARYSVRTRQDYSNIYRRIETNMVDGRMFGEIQMLDVSRPIAYALYETSVLDHGHDSANKSMTACQAAFRYAMLKFAAITVNPFGLLDKFKPPSRRQRWSDEQIESFIHAAQRLGYPSIGCCALLCMELMQRPGDILDLKWSSYDEREQVWHIQQTKRGAVVRVPETRRLRSALASVGRSVRKRSGAYSPALLVCPTATGKRWHRRNFTKAARRIARAAGLPDELQIRDLRRTAATEAASAGATPAELMSIGGWSNQASIRPYLVQTLEQASAVQAKRDAYRGRR
jgi:integrase